MILGNRVIKLGKDMSEDKPRTGEEAVPQKRKDRTFQNGDYWYFTTREGVEIGPFDSKELAEKGASEYAGFAVEADPELLDSLSGKK